MPGARDGHHPAGRREFGKLARECGALFLLDAAKTIGEIAIDVEELHVDLLAAQGHKGLFRWGPGFCTFAPGSTRIPASRQGGTGTHSDRDRQPTDLPQKYEAGNLNVPGIAGLGAGLGWLAERHRRVALHNHQAHRATDRRAVHDQGGADLRLRARPKAQRGRGQHFAVQGRIRELAATLDAAFGVQVHSSALCAADAPGRRGLRRPAAVGDSVLAHLPRCRDTNRDQRRRRSGGQSTVV